MTLQSDAKFEGKLTVVWKMTWRIWQIFTGAKQKVYELKIYRGAIICHDNEEWYKILRGIDLSFQNWHEEFDKFLPEHLTVSKIYTLMVSFLPKYKMFELKKYRWVMFDSTEDWWKYEGKLICTFKNTMRNLENFYTLKSSNFILESKMAELNQNQNSKQRDRPDTVWKLYFTMKIN